MFKNEDFRAVSVALLLLIIAAGAAYFSLSKSDWLLMEQAEAVMANEEKSSPFKTVAYRQARFRAESISPVDNNLSKAVRYITAMPGKWNYHPLSALYENDEDYRQRVIKNTETFDALLVAEQQALTMALEAENAALALQYADTALNQQADAGIVAWANTYKKLIKAGDKLKQGPANMGPGLLLAGLFFALLFGLPMYWAHKNFDFIKGFAGVFAVAVLSLCLESQVTFAEFGFGFPLWAIVIGAFINNVWGTPQWMKPALQTEFFIKTGLVLLGAEVLFSKVLEIGLPGLAVAWVVTPVVLVSTYWFGQKVLKMESKTLNITISADMSVCGVSAAVATAAACKAKKEELTLAVGLSMAFTAIMMVALPALIKAWGIPQVLGGAWIGGTLDSTGAVVAAGAFLGDTALTVAATIKMIQNVLIGFIAFGVAAYWSAYVEKGTAGLANKPGLSEIWLRFPKFIIGFMAVSLVFSIWYAAGGAVAGPLMVEEGVARGFTKHFREWFFCLAFVSIGLSTDFKSIAQNMKGGKALQLYLIGQAWNMLLTFAMAYAVFGWR